jgi:hypothetical protein
MDREKLDYTPFKPFSEKTAEIIDTKVKEIVKTAYKKAIDIVKKHRSTIDNLAKVLLKKEYLTKDEFENIIKNPTEIENYLSIIEGIAEDKKNILKKEEKTIKQDTLVDKKKPTGVESILDKFLPTKEDIKKIQSKKVK